MSIGCLSILPSNDRSVTTSACLFLPILNAANAHVRTREVATPTSAHPFPELPFGRFLRFGLGSLFPFPVFPRAFSGFGPPIYVEIIRLVTIFDSRKLSR